MPSKNAPSELLAMQSFDFLVKLEHQRLWVGNLWLASQMWLVWWLGNYIKKHIYNNMGCLWLLWLSQPKRFPTPGLCHHILRLRAWKMLTHWCYNGKGSLGTVRCTMRDDASRQMSREEGQILLLAELKVGRGIEVKYLQPPRTPWIKIQVQDWNLEIGCTTIWNKLTRDGPGLAFTLLCLYLQCKTKEQATTKVLTTKWHTSGSWTRDTNLINGPKFS